MNKLDLINTSWCFYIDGWYHHNQIIFLENGKIDNNGTEGIYRWSFDNNLLYLYDELDVLCYTLNYIESAKIFISISNHRIKNNNILLSYNYSSDEISSMFDNDLSKKIAHIGAFYKSSKGEVWGRFFFGIDGKIYNYNHPNEQYWQVKDDKLHIYSQNQTLTLTQKDINYQNSSKTSIKNIALNFMESNTVHYLDFLEVNDEEKRESVKYVNFEANFSNRSDTLLVIFNSAGGEYNGQTVKHEFYHLPYKYSVDYIRISQSAPTRWYLDNHRQIETMIMMNEYKHIVLLGMSIGGYSAIWFAEQLARKYPSIKYNSIAIQPLASLDMDFVSNLRSNFSDGYRAKTPTNDVIYEFNQSGLELNLSHFLKQEIPNVEHCIVYDQLNNAERLNANQLISNRTKLLGFSFDVKHADGCVKIYDSGIINKLCKTLFLE